ncbi:MAG: pirin family protein [Pseudomonadota bacterium]
MALTLRRAEERGTADLGWLNSKHTFSFGHYFDPQHIGFGSLRVINEDRVAPGGGFATHPHANMEIISYVISGALEHKDSMGNGSIIRPGDVQVMSAGTGVRHSEYNASNEDPVHFLQIWIVPERDGLTPGYEQEHFAPAEKKGQLRLIGSRDGRDGSVTIHQDVEFYASVLSGDDLVRHHVADGRGAWVQVISGSLVSGEETLHAGDALSFSQAGELTFSTKDSAEFLLFDLPY